MDGEYKGEKEKDKTPAEKAPEKKPDGPTDEEKAIDERIATKKKQLSQLEEATKEHTDKLKDLRGQYKELKLVDEPKEVKPENPQPKPATDDYFGVDDSDEDKFNKMYEDRRKTERDEDYRRVVNQVAHRFFEEHEEFAPDKDLGGVFFAKFKERANTTFLGETSEAIRDSLEFILRGFKTEEDKSKETNEITDVGDFSSRERKVDKEEIDKAWETKKLNPSEKKAAELYEGGDKAYRKAQAELEKQRNRG